MTSMRSFLIYTRILEPCTKRSSYKAALEFLEKPSCEFHDVYRALDVLGAECDLIQAEAYKNSHFMGEEMIRSFIMTARIITLRANRKKAVKNTGRVKNTGQPRLFKWGCSWMGMGFFTHSPFFWEMQTNRHR